MTNEEYSKLALTFDSSAKYKEVSASNTSIDSRLVHAALGMSGEVGEVVEIIKKRIYYGKPMDNADVVKEIGDVLWYVNVLLDTIGSSFSEAMQSNIDKLSIRYENGYSDKAALARKDVK